MQLAVVEFLLDLSPYVFKQILSLLVGMIVEGSLEGNALCLFLGQIDLLDATLAAQIQRLEILVGMHGAASDTFQHNLCLVLQQVVFPQVIVVLEGCLVVQRVAARAENGIAQMAGIDGKSDDAVAGIL